MSGQLDESGARRRHVSVIRDYLSVKPFDGTAQQLAEAAFRAISHTREDLTDLINAAITELVRQRYELPVFRTLVDAARRIRDEINRQYYHSVYVALGKQRSRTIDDLLLTDGNNHRSLWQSIKLDPGAPTLKEFQRLVERLKWLKSLPLHDSRLFAMIPYVSASLPGIHRHYPRPPISEKSVRTRTHSGPG